MSILDHISPAMPPFHLQEQVRASLGALIGLSICAAFVSFGRHAPDMSLMLIAPLGATAVLVFCVPNSPLAQPWSAVVGNVLSASVALGVVMIVPAPWSAGIAVGGAIFAMMLVRALHPPGGAVALLAALEPVPVIEAGLLFALLPVGLLTATLVLAAVAFNRATGRVYPFRHVEPTTPTPRLGLNADQIGDLLIRFNQTTNMGIADLGRLLAAAEQEAAQHRFDGTACADVMTRDLITLRPDTPVADIVRLFRDHPIKSLPVVDAAGHLCGLVLQVDLLAALEIPDAGARGRTHDRPGTAADVMRPADRAVAHDLPVGTLLDCLAAQGSEVVPVTRDDRLVGILTRSDIIRLLLRGAEGRQAA